MLPSKKTKTIPNNPKRSPDDKPFSGRLLAIAQRTFCRTEFRPSPRRRQHQRDAPLSGDCRRRDRGRVPECLLRFPVVALAAQGAVALILILLPGLSDTLAGKLGRGFESAVEYTAPVFWAFLLLTGLAVFVLRFRLPTADRPLGSWVGLVMAIVLCVMSAYMLYSSLVYTRIGSLVGVGVLLAGLPVYAIARAYQGR